MLFRDLVPLVLEIVDGSTSAFLFFLADIFAGLDVLTSVITISSSGFTSAVLGSLCYPALGVLGCSLFIAMFLTSSFDSARVFFLQTFSFRLALILDFLAILGLDSLGWVSACPSFSTAFLSSVFLTYYFQLLLHYLHSSPWF